jgi:hypothetical protein
MMIDDRERFLSHNYFFCFSLAMFQIRMFLYLFTAMAEDVETQKKGQVSIYFYGSEDLLTLSREKDNELFKTLVEGIPVRYTACHICLSSGSSGLALALARAFVYFAVATKDRRPRIKFHNGLGLEIQYKLMGLGIPMVDLPISNTMSIKTKNHHRWIRNRILLEVARSKGQDTSHWIEFPGTNDVLFRQGGNHAKQVNIEFMALIESKMDAYFVGNVTAKERVRDEIINTVHARGGIFLEYNRQMELWVHIQEMKVLSEKLYSAFYYHKLRVNARQQQPRQESNCQADRFIETNKRRKIGEEDNNCCSCFRI